MSKSNLMSGNPPCVVSKVISGGGGEDMDDAMTVTCVLFMRRRET